MSKIKGLETDFPVNRLLKQGAVAKTPDISMAVASLLSARTGAPAREPGMTAQPLSRISRERSRSQSRFFSVSRLSCSFLPRAERDLDLRRPRSLK